jgi:hypothetical protein
MSRPIPNPYPLTDGVARHSGAIGSQAIVIRMLNAGTARSAPAEVSRGQADGEVRDISPGPDLGRSCFSPLNSRQLVLPPEKFGPRGYRFAGIAGVKSSVLPWTFNTLRCLIKYGVPEWCAVVVRIRVFSWFSTQLDSLDSLDNPTWIGRAGTPKAANNCDNRDVTCYALVTHKPRHLMRKGLMGLVLQTFLPRSSKRLSLGRQNREFCGKARKSYPPVTPQTPKTPVCVTHILRTPAPFPHAGPKVASQTQKVGVMQVLCTPFDGIWTDLDAGANVWQRSE